jgi:hypothetical protein
MMTEATWTQRVAAWRVSGLTAAEFSDGRGFAAATLRWWASRLRNPTKPPQLPLARLVTRPSRSAERAAPIVVELAGARVLVPSGVARADLVVVLDALDPRRGGGSR